MIVKEENSGSSNNGGKSRFFERLKKIQRDKRKKNRITDDSLKKQIDNRVFFKPFLVISSFFLDIAKNNDRKQENKINVSDAIVKNDYFFKNNQINNNNDDNKFFEDTYKKGCKNIKNGLKNVDKNKKIQSLQLEIIDLIRKRLIKNINEFEVLQSELYILKELTGEDIYLTECEEKIKNIKKLLSKIKNLKEKYNYLRDNIDFDSLIQMSDDSLVDKIVVLKDICDSDDIYITVQNYKILEEYKYLYLKIDKFEDDLIKYNEYKKSKEEELRKRNINFELIKNEVYNKQIDQEKFNSFVLQQNIYFNELNEKILNIDSREVVSYKLRGFNQLLSNSFKYLGLLLISPLKGIFPGIVSQTIVTRNIVHNLYNNLEWENEKKVVYEAIDFSKSINNVINDLDSALNLVNVTLSDIKEIKLKYKENLSKYEYSLSEYSEVFKKLNKIENAILNNKIKIELMQVKMCEKKQENKLKLEKVKKLNSSME